MTALAFIGDAARQSSMHWQVPRPMQRRLLMSGVAAILLGMAAVGIVSGTGWLAAPPPGGAEMVTQEQPADADTKTLSPTETGPFRGNTRCDECGVIESLRQVATAGNSPAIYEVTVRMGDGSTHTRRDASPPNWRAGERIILIAGGIPSDR